MVKSKHITKSNNLIDCSCKLTLNEQRFINMAFNKLTSIFVDKNLSISELKELVRANVFREIEIGLPEYKKEFGVNSDNIYMEIENIANSLYGKEIVYLDKDNTLVRKRWIITCKLNKSTEKVTIKFHPDLIMNLMMFKDRYANELSFIEKKSFIDRLLKE